MHTADHLKHDKKFKGKLKCPGNNLLKHVLILDFNFNKNVTSFITDNWNPPTVNRTREKQPSAEGEGPRSVLSSAGGVAIQTRQRTTDPNGKPGVYELQQLVTDRNYCTR